MKSSGRSVVLDALSGAVPARRPIWLMRQAGRYLPEYREVRAGLSFLDLVRSPSACTEVALQPLRRYDLDATIVFSDILVIPDALDMDLSFEAGEGPKIGRTLLGEGAELRWQGVCDRLGYVYDAVSALRVAAPDHALFGFAGAPWTLYCYMVQGGGSSDFAKARTALWTDPDAALLVLDQLAGIVVEHLRRQHAAGADVVQLFDTWGGLLAAPDYARFIIPSLRKIAAGLQGIPSVLFVRGGGHLLPLLSDLGFSAYSLDHNVDVAEARRILGRPTQGNLDNTRLLGPPEAVREGVLRIHRSLAGARDHIWNLGHGVLPPTPPDSVASFVEAIRSLE